MTISRFKTLATPPVPTRVEIAGPAGPGRDNAEAFIRERFAEAWGADVQHFLPLLMSLRESRGRLLGALALRFAAVGGAPVTPRLLGRAAALVLPVFEGYGLSECASVVCLNTPDANRPGSVGHPRPHVRLTLTGDGEIQVDGEGCAGYLGEAPPTPARSGWPTGDLGWLDPDGFLYLKGRRRNLFITAFGRNVAPEWVEGELTLERAMAQAAVFGEAHPIPLDLLTPGGCA